MKGFSFSTREKSMPLLAPRVCKRWLSAFDELTLTLRGVESSIPQQEHVSERQIF